MECIAALGIALVASRKDSTLYANSSHMVNYLLHFFFFKSLLLIYDLQSKD